MKCPKCGSVNCRYVISRKKHWKKGKSSKGTEARIDFNVKCTKCGFNGVIK